MTGCAQDLLLGNQEFQTSGALEELDFQTLATGQTPRALVISCSDSRVNPDQIFNTKPGSLLVVRNIGGFVPAPDAGDGARGTHAAIEFAVAIMNVESVIVLTHSGCKGIATASSPRPAEFSVSYPHLSSWLESMDLPVSEDPIPDIEQSAARLSLANLAKIPSVAEAQATRGLEIAAMHFDIATGKIAQV